MKTSIISVTLLAALVSASPLQSLVKRQTQVVLEILKVIGFAINTDANVWDYGGRPQMCAITMKTQAGGNCHADLTCADGAKRDYHNRNVCFLGGEQNFSDPGIGEFFITFTQKDDDCGDGLCAPVLKLKNIGNWMAIDVKALSDAAAHNAHFVGVGDPSPFANPSSRNICASTTDYNNEGRSNICGMPAIGKAYGPGGLDSQGPVNDRGYAPGWCGLHVTQHQKVNQSDPNSHYQFDITIKDNNEDVIGSVSGADTLANIGIGVTSKLPWVVVVTAQNVDEDPVLMPIPTSRGRTRM